MKRSFFFVTLVLVLQAQAQPKERIYIHLEHKASATEQLEYARTLMKSVDAAKTDYERNLAIGTVAAHLEDVISRWPSDKASATNAYLLEYDLFSLARLPFNALDSMNNAEPLVRGSAEEAAILRRKALVLAQLGRQSEASDVFTAAQNAAARATGFERLMVLHDIADFNARNGKHADSAKYYRKLAHTNGLERSLMMTNLVQAIEEDVRAGDTRSGRADYADLQASYESAQMQTLRDEGSTQVLQVVRNVLERYRSKFGS